MPATFQVKWALAAVSFFTAGADMRGASPSSAEARGRALFREGIHADGTPLTAVTGDQAVPLPAAFVACIHCHGQDARGKTEGGITTSDIRWDTLAKPYELSLPGGRRRGPYDTARFFTALTQGQDSSGRPLDPAMPRFHLSMAEASDLIAYLHESGGASDEGVTDEVIRLGFEFPTDPLRRAAAEADRQIAEAWLARTNRQGGIFRRRLELVTIEPTTPRAVLAMIASEGAADKTLAPTAIPSLRATAQPGGPNSRYEFALYPGLVGRATAIVRHAVALSGANRPALALVYDGQRTSRVALNAVMIALQPLAVVRATSLQNTTPNEAVQEWREAGVGSVLLLGEGPGFADLLTSAGRAAWDPLFLWTDPPAGTTAGRRSLGVQRVQASEPSPQARADYAACAAERGLRPSEGDQARQLALLALTQLLIDALNNTGREVNRERLIESLEALSEIRSAFGLVGGFTARRHTVVSRVLIGPLPGSPYRPEPQPVSID